MPVFIPPQPLLFCLNERGCQYSNLCKACPDWRDNISKRKVSFCIQSGMLYTIFCHCNLLIYSIFYYNILKLKNILSEQYWMRCKYKFSFSLIIGTLKIFNISWWNIQPCKALLRGWEVTLCTMDYFKFVLFVSWKSLNG